MGENAASTFWLEEYREKLVTPFSLKRKVKSKKHDFVGWGSKPLIDFLESIGKDTAKQISRYDVADIIIKYANENNLINPAKKKRILCESDERLYSIFGRKTIGRNKVYELLETHYAENQGTSDEDFSFSSEEDNPREEQKAVISEKKTYKKQKVSETPKSCYAKIIPENIKLVYLKSSLVQDLLKDFESFEAKVVGSFVRIKSDPNYFLHKNSHLLVLVKGLKKASGNNDINAILLEVSNYMKDVSISMLSDDDFSEEECEDLHQRVKNGLLKRPTVVELEAKAQSLHADITNHWIATEVTLLGKLMERANEKGWRSELFEYMERREKLQDPKEKTRLLLEVPNVIPDEMESETPAQGVLEDEHKSDSPATSTLKGTSEFPRDTASNGKLSTLMPSAADSAVQSSLAMSKDNTAVQPSAISKDVTDTSVQVQSCLTISKDNMDDSHDIHERLKQSSDNNDWSAQLVNVPEKDGHREKQSSVNIPDVQVIDLSDDDEDEEHRGSNEVEATKEVQAQDEFQTVAEVNRLMWHYTDPQGCIQGPFSLKSLKGWNDADYFPPDFKVWKTGQNKAKAELLTDIISEMFAL